MQEQKEKKNPTVNLTLTLDDTLATGNNDVYEIAGELGDYIALYSKTLKTLPLWASFLRFLLLGIGLSWALPFTTAQYPNPLFSNQKSEVKLNSFILFFFYEMKYKTVIF